ncbi:MAG: DoxX family protein [Mucilaginibacter sp.]|nr:DoxX family protein [Mucilaginibacter sp.]
MEPIQLLALMILGGSLNLIPKNANYAFILARAFFFLSCFAMLNYLVLYFSGIHEQQVLAILTDIAKYGSLIWRVLLGYFVVFISRQEFMDLYTTGHPDSRNIFLNALHGLSVLIGCIFIIATIGKYQNLKEMSAFFKSSGYTIWFLYFIMTAETAGGIGILLQPYLKIGPWAAIGLLLIMIGAIYTHWHNYDPFSDSYAAVAQMFNLFILIFLYYKEKQFHRVKHPEQVLSVDL